MSNDSTWQLESPELKALSDEVDQAFTVERALFSADMGMRVLHALPRAISPLVRVARMLSAVILISSLGVLALVMQLFAAHTGAWHAMAVTRVVVGLGTLLMAMLLTFAAPRLLVWESRLLTRVTGRAVRPGPGDLVLARVAAMVVLVAGAATLI